MLEYLRRDRLVNTMRPTQITDAPACPHSRQRRPDGDDLGATLTIDTELPVFRGLAIINVGEVAAPRAIPAVGDVSIAGDNCDNTMGKDVNRWFSSFK